MTGTGNRGPRTGSRSSRSQPIIAIDGPVGAGKSTIAWAVAQRLQYRYVDTGAMYRSVALMAMQRGIDLRDEPGVVAVARFLDFQFVPHEGGQRALVNGVDVTEGIRRPEVSEGASVVSAYPGVREAMVAVQRRLGAGGGVVMEGRDIGTVVFPDAEVKVFLDASPEERARRRYNELRARGVEVAFEELRQVEEERDERDRTRAHSPLRRASDALVIDTTARSVDETVQQIIAMVHKRR